MPKIFLLDGPAGSGKSTLTPIVLEHFGEKLYHCKRVTTRPQRPDDKNYVYIDQVAFGKYLTEGGLAAYRRFRGGYSYGVRRRPVEKAVANGKHVFSLMDLGTAEMARRVWPDCITIFLMAPLEILEKRLHEKGAHTEDEIKERLDNAAKAFSQAAYYDYVIPNRQGQLKKSTQHLISIFEKEMEEEGS
jgi:guanylate kinase